MKEQVKYESKAKVKEISATCTIGLSINFNTYKYEYGEVLTIPATADVKKEQQILEDRVCGIVADKAEEFAEIFTPKKEK